MPKISAGLLMYRRNPNLEVFLVHPGGPFFKFKDNVWSIPKGEQKDGESLLETAKREFEEETGIVPPEWETSLGMVEYNNKIVYCWAFENDLPKNFKLKSNLTKFGWPENDKGEFFGIPIVKTKILAAQVDFLSRLEGHSKFSK